MILNCIIEDQMQLEGICLLAKQSEPLRFEQIQEARNKMYFN